MEALIQHLASKKSMSHLWVERLTIFREPDLESCIRTIEFRRGINLIWAKEPPVGSAYAGIHAAGHGVGKTSLCLLLRYCLGDNAKSVYDLREELFGEFPHGGVAAVLHIEGKAYTVFRYFNPHKDGRASEGGDLEALLSGGGNISFKEFEAYLSETMISKVSPQTIPETGQAIEWRHLLAWMTRDQRARFTSYFAWREGEGTGLQRSRQDPPIVMRAVLGLLDQGESELLQQIHSLGHDLERAQQHTVRLKQEPDLIRRRIESELRTWLNAPDDLPLRTDDMFKESVEKMVEKAQQVATSKLDKADADYDAANEKLANARAERVLKERDFEKSDVDYQLADAARRQDETAYQKIANRREALKSLSGPCEHGEINFQDCQHIRDEIRKLGATSLRDSRDQGALASAGEEWTARAVSTLERKKRVEQLVDKARQHEESLGQECKALRVARDSAAIEVDRAGHLLAELERWEKTSGSPASAEAIEQSIARAEKITRDISNATIKLHMLKQERSGREKSIAELLDALVRAHLSNEAFGVFTPRDENRPFQLSVRGGEAYRVLEVLLGDLACMLDSVNPGSSFPGLLVHDCPREADMSSGLYENYLLLIENIEREAFGNEAPFQYIVTTTTPPPTNIQKHPYLREMLDPSVDDGLLFKQRFSGVRENSESTFI